MRQTQPVALITGTSSGFGLLTSLELAKSGYIVVATMRDLERKDQLVKMAEQAGVSEQIDLQKLDVTSVQDSQMVVKWIMDTYGRVDVLVNNAGFAQGGLVEELPLEAWRDQFESNFFGLISCTKAVLPYMRESRSGTIINMSSVSGLIALPGMGPYSASKYAVEGFSESLRLEVKQFGINVVLIEPGAFKTNVWDKGLASMTIEPASEYAQSAKRLEKMARSTAESAGDPMDVVRMILKAIDAPHPKLRYPVGKGIKLAASLHSFLPWRFYEKQLTKRF